ncbi:hypothetical protein QBC45DRAFT_810 [Copromyces sp. CBS 386.78]|nr:hypothetical protein QBC45DRAFT_810 [Copromyces sp. CBS 386.78]
MTEWPKVFDSNFAIRNISNLFGGAGSNPARVVYHFFFFFRFSFDPRTLCRRVVEIIIFCLLFLPSVCLFHFVSFRWNEKLEDGGLGEEVAGTMTEVEGKRDLIPHLHFPTNLASRHCQIGLFHWLALCSIALSTSGGRDGTDLYAQPAWVCPFSRCYAAVASRVCPSSLSRLVPVF